jgi:autotransporter-associated beta strand protein
MNKKPTSQSIVSRYFSRTYSFTWIFPLILTFVGLLPNAQTQTTTNTVINGGTITNGQTEVINLPTNSTSSLSITGIITNNGSLQFQQVGQLFNNNSIIGTGTITQIGSGTTFLGASNNYDEATYVTLGTLVITNASGLDNNTQGTVINYTGNSSNGGLLTISGNFTNTENFLMTNGTSGGGSAIGLQTIGTNILSGTITLDRNGLYRVGVGGSNSQLTITGQIQRTNGTGGFGPTAAPGTTMIIDSRISNNFGAIYDSGGGTVILNAASNQIGLTQVNNNSKLKLGINNALSATNNLLVGTAGGTGSDKGTVDLAGFNQIINALVATANTNGTIAGATNRIVTNSASGVLSTLTVGNGNGSGIFNGVINEGSGTIALVKTGSGTQTLLNADVYTGGTTLHAGTVAISNNASLGQGLATFASNSTIQALDNLSVSNNFSISSGVAGTFDVQNFTLTNSGTISGAGTLVKAGTGTLVLTASNSYGDTLINTGTLMVGNGGTSGTLGNGTVSNNAMLTINRSNLYSITNSIVGSGSLSQIGAGTTILSGINTYAGTTTIDAGTILLNGTHTGGAAYTVNTAGTLGGIGSTASLIHMQGGTLRPGNGVAQGTLTVGGLSFTGGLLNILLGGTTSSLLSVNGSANLANGTVSFTQLAGLTASRYMFLTNAGPLISTTFAAASNVPAGYQVVYESNSVWLEYTNTTPSTNIPIAPTNPPLCTATPGGYVPFAVTPNQISVATALNTFSPAIEGSDKCNVIDDLNRLTNNPGQMQQAFDAIAPTFFQSLSTMAFNAINAQYNDLVEQMFGLRVAGSGFSSSGFGDTPPIVEEGIGDGGKNMHDSKKDILRPGADNHWAMFVDGNGIFAQANSGNMLQSYNAESGGVITGLIYKWNTALSTGIYAGYEGTYAKFGYPYSGSTTIDNAVRFGFLGTCGDPSGKGFYGDALIGGTYHNYDITRAISFSGMSRTANSSPGAGELDSLIATGYNWKKGNWAFGPVSSLQYTYYGMNAFNESGAQSLDYQGLNWNTASMLYNLGGNCAYSWQANRDLMVVPQINLAWQHEFLQNPYNINGSLSGAQVVNTSATPLRDWLYTGVGVTLEYKKRWTTAFFYNAAAGNQDLVSQNFFWMIGARF